MKKYGVNEISSRADNKHLSYLFFKRFFDIVFSFTVIVLLLPVFIVFSLCIFLTDFHAPFYTQKRVGKNGKTFRLIKFRTMRHDAHDLDKYFTPEQKKIFFAEFKLENDPRITKIGVLLRKFSLDELPQFLNVLFGQMSIIGPRPLVTDELSFFGEDCELLLSVRPGISGMWQVSGRNDLTYQSGDRQRVELGYVKNFGFKTDLYVFFKTFSAVFTGNGL